jgi:hypothetical protein
MSDIVEKVKAAILSADNGWDENRSDIPHRDELARAAIKATIEYLRDNVSDGMKEAAMASDSRIAAFRGMLSQAIKEMEI